MAGLSFAVQGLYRSPMTNQAHPSIAVLLATYKGMPALTAQLDSFAEQTLRPQRVLVSDDGSDDGTPEAVEAFGARHPDLGVTLMQGPCRGAAANFMSLLARVPEDVDMIALSDQDDVWLPGKLERGAEWLARVADDQPALYCGRTWECDPDLGNRVKSRRAGKAPSFRHALVQNIAGGNTMMINRAGVALLRAASQSTTRVVVHDWWIYQMITGADGQVLFDEDPYVLYRQHGGNMIGANRGFRAKLRRFSLMLGGRLRRWNTINIRALKQSGAFLSEGNRALLERFAEGRNAGVFGRLGMLRATGVYRQGIEGQISLRLAALLGRL